MQKTVLDPAATGHPVWVYRYTHASRPWTLSIATHAEPESRKLSLGGFRIAPRELTDAPDFDVDRMAIGLALGMEEKVYWSRLLHVGGPLDLRDTGRIVGGKCVMHPTDDARVGQPQDVALLDFALECFRDVEATAGIYLTTGQDLGHGLLHDGRTQSLDYLAARYPGCVDADTSKPTGEGNYFVLKGMLDGLGIQLGNARVALVGVGNIGQHILRRLREHGTEVFALDLSARRRDEAREQGATVFAADDKRALLAEPVDAFVVNANRQSLDSETCAALARNPRLRVVCGSENLAMPDPSDAERL
ncbi:MAG TPA: NAD(P)-dependent oxidoreductase, partial [Gemmatimonadaceae bacterium]|nr:NAD(P)-dependent oxidoreductase [Gemmatimonadaceae bacterium]